MEGKGSDGKHKKKMLPSETSAYKVVKQTNGNSKNLENK